MTELPIVVSFLQENPAAEALSHSLFHPCTTSFNIRAPSSSIHVVFCSLCRSGLLVHNRLGNGQRQADKAVKTADMDHKKKSQTQKESDLQVPLRRSQRATEDSRCWGIRRVPEVCERVPLRFRMLQCLAGRFRFPRHYEGRGG